MKRQLSQAQLLSVCKKAKLDSDSKSDISTSSSADCSLDLDISSSFEDVDILKVSNISIYFDA